MGNFNNDLSKERFVSPGTDLERHIQSHETELAGIPEGSFDEIGYRMINLFYIAQCFFLASDGHFFFSNLPDYKSIEQKFLEENGISVREASRDPARCQEVYRFLNKYLFDKIQHRLFDIAFTGYESNSHGAQNCPFSDCDYRWDCNAIVLSREGVLLGLNEGTAHLAKKHHLLQAGNIYSTSPRVFYEHFMPKDPKDLELFEKSKSLIKSGQADKIPYLYLGRKF